MTLSASACPLSFFIACADLKEAEVAWNAIAALRAGNSSSPSVAPLPLPDADATLAERIGMALLKAPMNQPKEIVLRQLHDSDPQAWVAYPEMQSAFAALGLKPERTAAALRDLSWQMGEYLPQRDTAGFARKIEVLAERSRAGGVYRYRLTKAGRLAVISLFGT